MNDVVAPGVAPIVCAGRPAICRCTEYDTPSGSSAPACVAAADHDTVFPAPSPFTADALTGSNVAVDADADTDFASVKDAPDPLTTGTANNAAATTATTRTP